MNSNTKIYEGKAKILYEGSSEGTLIQFFKDDITANNSQLKTSFKDKGKINQAISEHLFNLLSKVNIPSHYIKTISPNEQLIHELEIIPIEVVVRNVVAGSMATRFKLPEGSDLMRSIIEFYYKKDDLNDPLVSEEHITAFGWASPQELDEIMNIALRVNDILLGYFFAIGIKLVDFKLEFGKYFDASGIKILLADEISPDTCRFWDIETNQKYDKDVFRRNLGDVKQAYFEIARRMDLVNESNEIKIKKPFLIN